MIERRSPERWAWAEVDLGAIRHNVARLVEASSPAAVWAVVKADGYGHGAIEVAGAALAAGAQGLCVALAEEGITLRRAGVTAPILVLSQQPPEQLDDVVAHDLISTTYTTAHVEALATAGAGRPHDVHLKVDTGMHRAGCAPSEAAGLAALIASSPGLRLAGVCTHLAVADEPENPFTAEQVRRFDDVLATLAAAGIDPGLVHLGNSAGALAHPATRRSFVRVGIAMYGLAPGPGVAHLCSSLRPALRLVARVAQVRRIEAGDRISYGLRHRFTSDAAVAVIPLGYADGVPRRSYEVGAEVLIGGCRCPVVGVVTMDQVMVDVSDVAVAVGDEVVLIGTQGAETITADEWARRLGTIAYEVTCAISKRIGRRVLS